MYGILKRIGLGLLAVAVPGTIVSGAVFSQNSSEDAKWQKLCDGVQITSQCRDQDGNKYTKYIFHEAEPEKTKQVTHPAEPAKTHTVHHPAEYGTRQVSVCIKTTISNKNGSCALSRCRDGEYSGSSGKGTCSYHGGVAVSGGPWYEQREESYLIKEAWDEVVVDAPAKEAWTETVVVSKAKEAWIEKELAE